MSDNELIAEFMGACIIALKDDAERGNSSGYHQTPFNTWRDCQIFCDGLNALNDDTRKYIPYHQEVVMKYKDSWDWLMPVLTKISKICFNDFDMSIEEFYQIRDTIPDLDTTYPRVISFIVKYNEKKINKIKL